MDCGNCRGRGWIWVSEDDYVEDMEIFILTIAYPGYVPVVCPVCGKKNDSCLETIKYYCSVCFAELEYSSGDDRPFPNSTCSHIGCQIARSHKMSLKIIADILRDRGINDLADKAEEWCDIDPLTRQGF